MTHETQTPRADVVHVCAEHGTPLSYISGVIICTDCIVADLEWLEAR